MNEDSVNANSAICQAKTKAGSPCKNHAQHGSPYCHVHQAQADAPSPEATPLSATAASSPTTEGADQPSSRASFEILANELNTLAAEIQRSVPEYRPPSFSTDGLVELIKSNLHKFTPDVQIEILSELKGNLEGTTPRDLIDPDTWKGLWYILNYMAQERSSAMRENLYSRLSALPGMALLSDIKGNLEGTSPKEFLDPDTWKGMWLIMSYSVQATAADLKRKLVGDSDNGDDGGEVE